MHQKNKPAKAANTKNKAQRIKNAVKAFVKEMHRARRKGMGHEDHDDDDTMT